MEHDYMIHTSIHDLQLVLNDGDIVKADYDFATCTTQGYGGKGDMGFE